jgi:hypothetical protein
MEALFGGLVFLVLGENDAPISRLIRFTWSMTSPLYLRNKGKHGSESGGEEKYLYMLRI